MAQLVYSLLAEPCHLANQRYTQADVAPFLGPYSTEYLTEDNIEKYMAQRST